MEGGLYSIDHSLVRGTLNGELVGLEVCHIVLVKDHHKSVVAELSNRDQVFVVQQREDMGLECVKL